MPEGSGTKKRTQKHTSGHILLQWYHSGADITEIMLRCLPAAAGQSVVVAVSFLARRFHFSFFPRQQIYSNRIDLCTSAFQREPTSSSSPLQSPAEPRNNTVSHLTCICTQRLLYCDTSFPLLLSQAISAVFFFSFLFAFSTPSFFLRAVTF